MARRKTTQAEAPAATNGTESITKSEAIRRAIAAGADQPIAGVNYIRENFGLNVTTAMFSTTKSQMKRKGGNGRRKGGRPRKVEAAAAPEAAPATGGVSLVEAARAVTAVQGLVEQFGKAAVKQLVDQLG
jgi:hypothetical protein